MKIAVIGSGAMGLLFGARLGMSGNEVTMIDVIPAVIEKINKDGIHLEADDGDFTIPIKACTASDMTEHVELAILFTKTIYSRPALENSNSYMGPDTHMLTMQNGLGNIELINEFLPLERIIAGVTTFSGDIKGPGHTISHGTGYLRIMSADGRKTEVLETICRVLSNAGLSAEIVPDVMVAIWEKVAFNAAINATSAICHVPCGGMGACAEGEELIYKISDEACMVASAYGVAVNAESVRATLKRTLSVHKDHFTSMGQDVIAKRKTENDFICGGIMKMAKAKGLSVPNNEAMYAILKVVENTYDMSK